MSALQSDWSYAGLKGIIPSLLHYSLLGYNFFIPDAVGNRILYIFNITSNPFTSAFFLSVIPRYYTVKKAHSLGNLDSNMAFEICILLLWATGGSLSIELVTDDELFIRWLEIIAFLPVLSFQTPPWASDKVDKVTSLTHII